MGAGAVLAADLEAQTIGAPIVVPTTGEDTRRLAASLEVAGIDLLLFVGGDGTARDVQAAVGASAVVLGVPAGVKIQSGVFGTSATAAGETAARYLSRTGAPTLQGEVLDLDEEAYRRGEVAPRLFGYLCVPQGRRVQGRKMPSPAPELLAMQAIAADILEGLEADILYVLGPGTTVRGVAERLGVRKTLVGVDAMRLEGDTVRLVAADVGERELLALVGSTRARIVLTPIGGQGFLLGRGNRPISPLVIHTVGRAGMLIVATPAKLATLGGRPLLVDTGDPVLDAELSGHVSVITGYRERAIVALAAG
jgi:predicted polyphosphate/ATP-dependent NAD kinase